MKQVSIQEWSSFFSLDVESGFFLHDLQKEGDV